MNYSVIVQLINICDVYQATRNRRVLHTHMNQRERQKGLVNKGLQIFERVSFEDNPFILSTINSCLQSNDWNLSSSDKERDFGGEKIYGSELRSTERLLGLYSTLDTKELDKRRVNELRRCGFDEPTESAFEAEEVYLLERGRRGGVFSTDIYYA